MNLLLHKSLIDNNKSNLQINYNTNLSLLQYKKENLPDLWRQFKKVNIWASQDGVGKVAEYIRKELDFVIQKCKKLERENEKLWFIATQVNAK